MKTDEDIEREDQAHEMTRALRGTGIRVASGKDGFEVTVAGLTESDTKDVVAFLLIRFPKGGG